MIYPKKDRKGETEEQKLEGQNKTNSKDVDQKPNSMNCYNKCKWTESIYRKG